MPESDKQSLLKLIEQKPWAKQDLHNLKEKAKQGDGYTASFVYALTGNLEYLTIAKQWLLEIAIQGGDLGGRALNVKNEFFNQGMPWLGDVFYQTNTDYLEAYDYIYNGLSEFEKIAIEKGITASAKFRQKSMDTWWQTANLVFKPTSMVAIAGLVTQNPELINWGFFRKPESNIGGYFSVLNNMLKNNGPWYEAPIYAITHLPLYKSLKISNYLSRMTNLDWFNRKLDSGSSVRGLMDYYINTTYPAEIRPDGSGVYRVLTYGDGATGQRGDTYLISQNSYQRNLLNELSLAYELSKDPDYAAFLKQPNNYQPNFFNRPELPVSPLLPKAKSSIWPDFGLAFLRSDNSNGYWTNPNAIAASLLFRQGYGHGHADALSLTLFAAGKLFYPDYNAIQYENPAIGWTSSSIAHNTVVVDGNNSSIPRGVNTIHEFTDDFRLIQANVAEPLGLSKKRTLALTSDYLLDVFHINSLIPRTYDYLLHSFGKIVVDNAKPYTVTSPFSTRYKSIQEFKTLNHDDLWAVDFVIDLAKEQQKTKRLISKYINGENTEEKLISAFGMSDIQAFKISKINFQMAGEKNTLTGIGEDQYGLSFLAARRENKKQTTFIALHTPSYLDPNSPTQNIETLINNSNGSLVKVTTQTHIDLHAIGHVDGQVSLKNKSNNVAISFSDYAFLRINKLDTEITKHGSWQGYFIPADLVGNDQDISFGQYDISNTMIDQKDSQHLQVNIHPMLVVLKDFAESNFTLSLTNQTNMQLSARVELQDNPTYDIPINEINFPPIAPFHTVNQKITLGRYKQTTGIDVLPIKITLDNPHQVMTHGIMVSPGPGLTPQYENTDEPVYRIHTFNPTVDFGMREGLVKRITDKHGKMIFSGQSLFDVSDGKTIFSPQKTTIKTSYTWPNRNQASLITEINNLIRWHMFTIQDRFYIKLDEVYTRLKEVFFIFDKKNSVFDWKEVKFLKARRAISLSNTKQTQITTNAFELPFKDNTKSLCINTQTTKNWINTDKNLSLPLSRDGNDQWSFSLCEKDSLVNWKN